MAERENLALLLFIGACVDSARYLSLNLIA